MKTKIPQPIGPDRSEAAHGSQMHDFNMEAVVANNFGQGDDYAPDRGIDASASRARELPHN